MLSKEFTTGLNPFFLFRESLQIAFEEYEHRIQKNKFSENVRRKPDATVLSKIVSRLWKRLPPSVRRGWERHAKKNRERRDTRKDFPKSRVTLHSTSENDSESDFSSDALDGTAETELNGRGLSILVMQLTFVKILQSSIFKFEIYPQ